MPHHPRPVTPDLPEEMKVRPEAAPEVLSRPLPEPPEEPEQPEGTG